VPLAGGSELTQSECLLGQPWLRSAMWLRPARQPPDLHVVVSTNRRSRRATYAAVC